MTDASRYAPTNGPPTAGHANFGMDAPLTLEPAGASHRWPLESMYAKGFVSVIERPSASQEASTRPASCGGFCAGNDVGRKESRTKHASISEEPTSELQS